MATVFGFTELRSRLDDWRSQLKVMPSGLSYATGFRKKPAVQQDDGVEAAHELSLLIENLVIPRLIADSEEMVGPIGRADTRSQAADDANALAKSPAPFQPAVPAITSADVTAFTRMTVADNARALIDFIDGFLDSGISVESIYLDLLAPAARRLGEYWENDRNDFVDVTMGLWRIQEVLRELTLRVPPPMVAGFGQRSALFATLPGEQHSLGTLMLAECFHRAGWDTDMLIEPTRGELLARFANRNFDLIGLTVSCDCPTDSIAQLITAIKSVSSNSAICIMLGGRLINDNPHLVGACGADATAPDAASAVVRANELVPLTASVFERLA
jgi:methanogenic corrinoid protein MtbC1